MLDEQDVPYVVVPRDRVSSGDHDHGRNHDAHDRPDQRPNPSARRDRVELKSGEAVAGDREQNVRAAEQIRQAHMIGAHQDDGHGTQNGAEFHPCEEATLLAPRVLFQIGDAVQIPVGGECAEKIIETP